MIFSEIFAWMFVLNYINYLCIAVLHCISCQSTLTPTSGLDAYSPTQLGHAARKSLARGDVVEAGD